MKIEQIFNKSIKGLDKEFADALIKWKRLIISRLMSIQKLTPISSHDLFQDFMLEMCEEYVKFRTPLYMYKGHSYILTEKSMGAYRWIETPSWNKKFKDGRWILREQLIPVPISNLQSYIYRQITQFHTDYLSKCFTLKNGYSKKILGKKTVNIYSGNGSGGLSSKEVDRVVCKKINKSVSIDKPIGDTGATLGDVLGGDIEEASRGASLSNLLEIMSDNMSRRGYEIACRVNILGEHLTLTDRSLKILSREMDLVKQVLEGKDPLGVINDGVAPVRFGLDNIE